MCPDSVVSTAWDAFKIVFVFVKHRFEYVKCYKRYADGLWKEVENLKYEAARIREATEEARNNLRNIHEWVEKFLASAEKALNEAEDLLGKFEKMSKTCCRGTLPDPFCRYQFSRMAKRTTDDIKNLILDIGGKEISTGRPAPGDIASRREGKGVVQPTTTVTSTSSALTSIKLRDDAVFESRASVMRKIMDALADDTKSMVGVHGMGGVGKSTLLVDVERILREKKSFDWVAKADVSQNPDIKMIQKEIAHCLGLSKMKEEEDVKLRAKLLLERLEDEERNKRKVLVILDDLWEQLDLKSVGIPCGHNNKVKGCKLLMTARDQYVLEREMLCVAFHLGFLKDEEAKGLFEATVGGKVRVELEPLVEKALRICGGLPFLILMVAKLFINTTYSECENALNEILNEEAGERIDKTLRVSYNRLKREEQSLLRLCAVYGVSKPSLENLVRYGVGLKLFGPGRSMKDAREMLGRLIRTLQASSLLLHSEEDDGFKIHDLVRMFVALIVSRDHPLLVLKDESAAELWKDKVKSCEALCFPYVNLEELPEDLDCPDLKIFMLFTYKNSVEIPDSYFNSMGNLMVLDLMSICLRRSPLPFQSLEKLHTLRLRDCSLENVAILGELKELQILCIQSYNLHRLPQEIGQLTELRLLDLNGCSQLQMIEPGVLGSLTKLEELYMKDSFVRWNAMDQMPPTNASLSELNNMKNLCILYVSILNASMLQEDLNFKRLYNYRIRIGGPQYWKSWKGSSILELHLDPKSNVLRKECIQSILDKTDDLFLEDLNGSEQSICTLSHKGFPELKHLAVVNSPSVHYMLQSQSHASFEKLESLLLENLIRLEKICHSHISSKSFGTLKVVRVQNCNKMEILFPLSVVRGLPQLEEIAIDDCKSMRGIVEVDGHGRLELPKLHVLKLHDLPNIKSFFIDGVASSSRTSGNQVGTPIAFFNGQQVSIPSLESLTMEELPNLKELWTDDFSLEISNLQSIEVKQCQSLSKIISFRSLMNLHKLQTITIRNCISLQEIFYLEEPRVSGNYTTLYELIPFSLEKLMVDDCDNLRFMFFPSMVKTLAQLRVLEILRCKKMETIIMEEEPLGLETSETLAFPMLINLYLEGLESLTCFFRGKSSREAQSHDLIQSRSTALFNREVAFPRLETLKIIGLENLRFIFFPSVVKSLAQLRKLTVSKCTKIGAIITEEEGLGLETTKTLAFPIESEVAFKQLRCIKLDGLRELRCFSLGGYPMMFPLLEDIIVGRCPNMKFFSKGRIEAPHMKRVQAGLNKSFASTKLPNFWEGNLNTAIESMFEEMGTFASVEEMWLSEIPELMGKWDIELNSIKSYWQLESMVVHRCPSFVNAISPKLMLVLDNLSTLQVYYCELLEEIFDFEGLEVMETTRVLPQLRTLTLGYLPKLRQLWNKDLQGMLPFNSLTGLALYKCSNLRHAFAPSMVQCLANLWWMEIKECGQMEKVIAEEEGQRSTVEKITFMKLWSIELECLPNLTSFLSGKNHILECPILKWLSITHCPKMRSLTSGPSLFTPQVQFLQLEHMVLSHMDNLSQIWTDSLQETPGFDSLRRVEAQNCKSLENLFPYWVATSLNQLDELRLESCGIEEIVTSGDDTPHSNVAQVLFPKLTSLVLHNMSQLKSFCPDRPTLNWPLVEELRVTHCDKLNKLSFAASMNSLAQIDDQRYLSDQEAHSSFERDFPNLKRLLLVDKDVQIIKDGKFPDDILGKPKALTLACFHDENAVFPLAFLLERFQNLQILEIFCSSFQDIFPDEMLVDEGRHLMLESLKELKLSKLHNLKRVWREDYLVSKILQSLKTFEVWDCPGLTTLFPSVTSFQNLTKLVVKNSFGLVHLVTVSAVMNLAHLTWMTVIGCERMKEVVENDANGEEKLISFGKLERLTLQQLPSLECFSSTTSCSFKFPSLFNIEVEGCPKMKIFSKGMLSTPKLKSISLFGYELQRSWEGDLNAIIQKLSA